MGVHDGHRQRMIRRFLEQGLDSFTPHEVLELLLFFAVPRRDINELAHRLIHTFGDLKGVFDAPYDQLLQVEGVGANTAALLKLMPQLTQTYYLLGQQPLPLTSSDAAGEYLARHYIGREEEEVCLICVDIKGNATAPKLIRRGGLNASDVSLRRVVSTALQHNAVGVILAHNHPNGIALPSEQDLATTRSIRAALETVGVRLMDHIIVADGDYVSLADSGKLE